MLSLITVSVSGVSLRMASVATERDPQVGGTGKEILDDGEHRIVALAQAVLMGLHIS